MADTSRKSSLKVWIITPAPVLGQKASIGIQCPYDDCKGKAVVNERKWRKAMGINRGNARPGTRSCTYCFRVSWVDEATRKSHERG